MSKTTFLAEIEVCRSYQVEIIAVSHAEAVEKAIKVAADQAEEYESFDLETNMVSVSKTKRMMYQ